MGSLAITGVFVVGALTMFVVVALVAWRRVGATHRLRDEPGTDGLTQGPSQLPSAAHETASETQSTKSASASLAFAVVEPNIREFDEVSSHERQPAWTPPPPTHVDESVLRPCVLARELSLESLGLGGEFGREADKGNVGAMESGRPAVRSQDEVVAGDTTEVSIDGAAAQWKPSAYDTIEPGNEIPTVSKDAASAVNAIGIDTQAHPAGPYSEARPISEVDQPASTSEMEPDQRRAAIHRDRRGRKRKIPPLSPRSVEESEATVSQMRAPAEARLRLDLHPIRQAVQLSLVLSRPEGFPERSAIDLKSQIQFEAFDGSRYDDIDIEWTAEFLIGELRFEGANGFRWVRSARRVHIFSGDPIGPGLVSVSAARIGSEHTIVCKSADAALVKTIASSTGSPSLDAHDHWLGIPFGWCVLSGYIPKHAAGAIADSAFRPLDPGFDLDIKLVGGMAIRPGVFAEGHAPRIELPILPDGVLVTIGGEQAKLNTSGGWEAGGWDSPGQHLIDIVPGPSVTYEIAADPASCDGWPTWDAYKDRFSDRGPWACASICGASVSGPAGEFVLAHEARPFLMALGSRDYATALQQRPDVKVSVGLLPRGPAFLVASSGQRRRQGEIIWLGLEREADARPRTLHPSAWASIVRNIAARRLPIQSNGFSVAKETWQRTTRRARNLKRRQT